MRIPRENLLNSVADVSPSGEYLSAIKNADQVIALFESCPFLLSPRAHISFVVCFSCSRGLEHS